MSIGIFVGTIGTRAGGMETYELSLLRNLARLDRETQYEIHCLDSSVAEKIGVRQPNFVYRPLWPKCRWVSMGITLPLRLLKSSVRLLHPTYVPPAFCTKEYVYTLHSSVTFVHPEFYPARIRWRLNRLQEAGIRKARVILCVSKHVSDFLAERFRIPEERLAVTYHGVGPEFREMPRDEVDHVLRERFAIRRPYLLYVGKLKENKNIERLLEAYQLFRSHHGHEEVQLVLAGRRLWTQGGLDRRMDGLIARGGVVELGHVEHGDLPALYSGAEALVFPSLWEGFGIPLIESMACGTPVLSSNLSSIPEVAGDAALLVDPYSVEELAFGMHRLVSEQTLRDELRAKGARRAAEFTWERTARQTLDAYQRALAMLDA